MQNLTRLVCASALGFGGASHASPIAIGFDMIADVEVNGTLYEDTRAVVLMKGLTRDLVETPSGIGPHRTLPMSLEMNIEGVDDFFVVTEVRAFAYPDWGYVGVLTPSDGEVFAFLSPDAIGFGLSEDLGPISFDVAQGTLTSVLQISIGLLAFHTVHSGTFWAESASPAPGGAGIVAIAGIWSTRRRRGG